MRRPEHANFYGRGPGYRYLRARGNSIEGGTSEILRNIVAERVLGLPARTPCRQRRAVEGSAKVSERPDAVTDELPDLLYSDAERALLSALASLLADRGGVDKALARVESAQTYDDKLWQAVAADLGCAGLLISERDGGAGAPYREAAAAAEVLGSFVAPVPFLGSAVVATAALLSIASGAPSDAASGGRRLGSTGTPFTLAKARLTCSAGWRTAA